jgi:arylsulfatase A-like enzyme
MDMAHPRAPRRLLWLLPLVVLLALGVYAVRARRRPAGLTPSSRQVARVRAAARGANVVLIVLDAARADHVGCYGYQRTTSPNLDRLAREGFVFRNHFTQFVETKPSTASLFTSQYPDTHCAHEERMLSKGTFTLARGLREAGYHTALFSQNGYASPMWGLGLEFHEAVYEPQLKAAGRQAPYLWQPEALLEQIGPWLERRPPEPFFAYIHFMPPHDPYIPPLEMYYRFYEKKPPQAWRSPYPFEEVEREVRKKEQPWDQDLYLNRYDSNLLYADWAVGQLEQMLRDSGLLGRTLLIITSDHGEAFGEHGYRGHVTSAYDENTRIPLILRFPGAKAPSGSMVGLSQTIDLLPTLYDLLGIALPKEGIQGRSLVPLLAGDVKEVNDYVFVRTAGQPPSYAVRSHRYLLLLYQGGKLRALYDFEKDPHAVTNIADKQPQVVAEMTEVFRAFARQQAAPPLDFADPGVAPAKLPETERVELTEDMKRSLKALGYLK